MTKSRSLDTVSRRPVRSTPNLRFGHGTGNVVAGKRRKPNNVSNEAKRIKTGDIPTVASLPSDASAMLIDPEHPVHQAALASAYYAIMSNPSDGGFTGRTFTESGGSLATRLKRLESRILPEMKVYCTGLSGNLNGTQPLFLLDNDIFDPKLPHDGTLATFNNARQGNEVIIHSMEIRGFPYGRPTSLLPKYGELFVVQCLGSQTYQFSDFADLSVPNARRGYGYFVDEQRYKILYHHISGGRLDPNGVDDFISLDEPIKVTFKDFGLPGSSNVVENNILLVWVNHTSPAVTMNGVNFSIKVNFTG